jgi:hypothetical protein
MRLFVAALLFTASVLTAAPITINGLNYYLGTPTESLNAPFTSSAGTSTANEYDNYVLVEVSGIGESLGNALNDAFYVFTDVAGMPIAPVHDANYYQLRVNTSAMAPFQPQFDIKNFIIYDVATGMQVTSPFVPAYSASHTYSFVIPVSGPSTLYFGVSDGNFGDNAGSYSLTVTQLTAIPEPSTAILGTCGLLFVTVRLLRRRRAE